MSKWVPSWRYVPIDYGQEVGVFENITQKCVFTNNLDGRKLRVRLNNLCSGEPMQIRHGAVALRSRVTGRLSPRMPLTLNGEEEMVVAADSAVYSDEILCPVSREEDIILYLYFGSRYAVRSVCTTCTWHSWQSVQYTGDFTQTEALGFTVKPQLVPVLAMEPYPNQFAAGVSEVSVLTDDDVKLIGLFGDSITHMSYFSDPLTAMLYDRFPGQCAVINGGISGNRIQKSHPVLRDFPGGGSQFGAAGKDRFQTDMYNGAKPDYVFLLEGVNDCSHSIVFREPDVPKAEDIFEALLDTIRQGQDRGSAVFVSTIPPFGAFGEPWRDQAEALRCEYNALIRSRCAAGSWIDLDAVMRDPDDPHRMQDGMNLGDGVHPNWAGGAKMARAVFEKFFSAL